MTDEMIINSKEVHEDHTFVEMKALRDMVEGLSGSVTALEGELKSTHRTINKLNKELSEKDLENDKLKSEIILLKMRK